MRDAGWRSALRIALLSMIEPVDGGSPLRRGFMRVGGKSLAWHQLDCALLIGCDRIICISSGLEPELIALQHEAEQAGGRFHVCSGPKDLISLINTNDEIFVFAEGLMVMPMEAQSLLESGPGVLVRPIENAVAAGFERIDLNWAWAGIARISGQHVDDLSELEPDCNIPSALTRIALQSGLPTREVPSAILAGSRWQIIRNETEAYVAENDWLGQQVGGGRSLSPGRWIARLGVLSFGSSLLHAGNASKGVAFAALGAMALGLGIAWPGFLIMAFLFVGAAWALLQTAAMLRKIESPVSANRSATAQLQAAFPGWVLDLELVVLAVWGSARGAADTLLDLAFGPIILVLLLRLVPQLRKAHWLEWISDRLFLSLILAVCAGFGIVSEAIRVMSVALALLGMGLSSARRG